MNNGIHLCCFQILSSMLNLNFVQDRSMHFELVLAEFGLYAVKIIQNMNKNIL